ncbi:metallophosphoesterase [Porphyromonas levii]|uniref:metallophosphoesterase n=1 Tax=Porphyromonas levii TaxID=28114 RepID=UPI001B8AEC45|nr:metallophosphoesterase [Porphyromonas levii]MDN4752925.1 metallophosphoesterase [Porphyromonadaceae bacterium W3.11]MBR8714095.1 hypothetical protein [Porphyromonas levii]MBR8716062.1 hypothetical protein [Porphyromonas levii]MBR8728591.1 hypothetical protein [Porphyromonas levii]MBR8730365.1 hypothetical protein [Porphyromonas levii]
MTKIQYASDLHLEFRDNSRYLKYNPLTVSGTILVLAGDIGYIGDDKFSNHPFWDWASDNYEQVIVVPGNHEFYKGYDLDLMNRGWSRSIKSNVTCFYNAVVPIGDNIELIVSTLWAKIDAKNAYLTELGVSDFRKIQAGGEPLTWQRFNQEHNECLQFIKDSVSQSTAERIIVATHHVPSFSLMSPEFSTSKLNGAFVSELSDFVKETSIAYWIYGHSHRNINGVIGRTRCVTNQLGYISLNEHNYFDPSKHIQI